MSSNTIAKGDGVAGLPGLVDAHGRSITYLRVSVTDRCDLRCVYCMPKNMEFLPREDLLDLEELEQICTAFVRLGVRKIRFTGGEPLVRKNIQTLIGRLSKRTGDGLDEITLTTNGTLLTKYAEDLFRNGVRRINVSLDTLNPELYETITRGGRIERVLEGLRVARDIGLSVKINALAMCGINDGEFNDLVEWCGLQGFDLTFIEAMPMGDIGACRVMAYMPVAVVKDQLAKRWTLSESLHNTSGPSQYLTVEETGCRVGFISPLSKNFCEGCNRVRLTCTGQLFLCLGQRDCVDLRSAVREGQNLEEAIRTAIKGKPVGHDFEYDKVGGEEFGRPERFMNLTGG